MKFKAISLVTIFLLFCLTLYSNDNKNLNQQRKVTTRQPSFTVFDWEYYVKHNNLYHVKNEAEALEHYQKIGFFNKLEYCKKFTIIILLHLYDLNLIHEFIDRINNLVRLNDLNNYILKINVPIDDRFGIFNHNIIKQQLTQLDENVFYEIDSPYHKNLITQQNARMLYGISHYLQENIEIDKENIQVIFSENRGAQIGGFFLLLDQVIKQGIKHDFIIKLHTYSDKNERGILASFLHVKLNKVLRHFQALYAKHQVFDTHKENETNKDAVKKLLSFFNLKKLGNFNFCSGGMFIASQAFTEFFKNYELLDLFNTLPKDMDYNLQKAYEQLFGYLIDYLGLNTLIVGFHPFKYNYDNNVAINSAISVDYDLDYVKKLIKKHTIKLMAIYFPQFHEFEENNKLWGRGFTEWTLINKFKGEIKKPHVDIGQYNILDYSTRKKQALIAKEHGIDAFCYYHYWFTDKKVMYAGLEKMLEDGQPNIPFVLCWANEPWTRNWDGSTREVLIDQKYGDSENWKKHFDYVVQFFKHPNYIKEDNCPLFYIYRLEHIIKNNALEMLKLWKELACAEGFNGLKIIPILGAFNPSNKLITGYTDGFAEHMPTYLKKEIIVSKQKYNDAQKIYKKIENLERLGFMYYSGVFYSFDHSSRRINLPIIKFIKLSYKSLENLFVNIIFRIAKNPNKETNYILLNSWNEWTEQAMFEPNDIDGYRLLQITKKIFR